MRYYFLRLKRDRFSGAELAHLAERVERNTPYRFTGVVWEPLHAPQCLWDINGDMLVGPVPSVELQPAREYLRIMLGKLEHVAYTIEQSAYDGTTRRTYP